MNPLVSVIIPTHNRADLLPLAIDSVLDQTCQDFEIVIIDNGSTDDTKAVVDRYVEAGAQVVYRYQENSGSPVGPRNAGVALAKGRYIALLDSDDRWFPGKLEAQLEKMKLSERTVLVYSDYFMIDNNGERGANYLSIGPAYRGRTFAPMLHRNFIPTSTVIMTRSAYLEAGGMDERYKITHDLDLYLKIASEHEIDYVDQPMAEIRMHSGSTSTNRVLLFEEIISIVKSWEERAVAMPEIGRSRYGRILGRYFFRAGIYAFIDGEKGVAADRLRRAVTSSPLNAIYFLSYLGAITMGWAAGPIFRFAARNKGAFVK